MASKQTILEAIVTSDVSAATKGFDQVGQSAKTMGADVAKASSSIDTSAGKVDRAAEASDNLASKSSQATGGLGALSAGFELVGAEKYAVGLQSAAMATDFFSGVGDIANLVLQSQAVLTVKNTALKIKDAVVTRGQAVATGIATAAQWAFNAALSANPLALVAIAVGVLVAAIVVAYKKSDRFKAIVDAAFSKAQEVIDATAKAIGALVGWLKDKLPAAGRIAKTLIVGYFKIMTLPARTLISVIVALIGWAKDKLPAAFQAARDRIASRIQAVRDFVGAVIDKVADLVTRIKSGLVTAFQTAKDKIKGPIDAVLGFLQPLLDLIGNIVEAIKGIKFPKPPDWLTDIDVNPFSKAGSSTTAATGPAQVTNITVTGALDPVATAQQIKLLLQREGLWNGTLVVA